MDLSEFQASLLDKVSSGTAMEKNLVSKTLTNQTNKPPCLIGLLHESRSGEIGEWDRC